MEVYLYLDKNTFLHKLDPRTKIFSTLSLFVLSLIFNNPFYLFILFCFIFILVFLSKSFINIKKLWIILILLFFFSSIFWSLFLESKTPFIKINKFVIGYEALLYGIAMGFRLVSMLIAGIIFLSTTKIEEFTEALQKIGVPFPLSFAISFAFRLVPTFIGTASTVIQAQKSRGLDLNSGNFFQRILRHIPLIIPVFVYGIRNANFLAMALESKGFGKYKKRESYLELRMKISDYIVLIFLIFLICVCFFFRLKGIGIVIERI
jgi:energy-coupling factor transport system permease protein